MQLRRISLLAAVALGSAALAQTGTPSSSGGTTTPSTTGAAPSPGSTGSGTMAPGMKGSDTTTGTMPGGTANTAPASTATGTTPDSAAILAHLHAANAAEVELGQLAQTKSQNKDVKKYAQHMVKAHTKMDKDGQAFAKKHKITTTSVTDPSLEADQKMAAQMKDKLSGLSGAEFDKAYMQGMADDHAKVLEQIGTFENQTTDKDLKKLLGKARKEVAEHKRDADQVLRKVGGTASR